MNDGFDTAGQWFDEDELVELRGALTGPLLDEVRGRFTRTLGDVRAAAVEYADGGIVVHVKGRGIDGVAATLRDLADDLEETGGSR